MLLGRRTIFATLIIFLIICQPLIVNADGNGTNIKDEIINPGSFYYSFKRLIEKIEDKIQLSERSRINYRKTLLRIRLSELNFVVNYKLLSEIQGASERFAYQAGILTEELVKQSDEDKKQTIKTFENYSEYLAKLRDKYAANTSFWMLIQHDINSLKILSDKLK